MHGVFQIFQFACLCQRHGCVWIRVIQVVVVECLADLFQLQVCGKQLWHHLGIRPSVCHRFGWRSQNIIRFISKLIGALHACHIAGIEQNEVKYMIRQTFCQIVYLQPVAAVLAKCFQHILVVGRKPGCPVAP